MKQVTIIFLVLLTVLAIITFLKGQNNELFQTERHEIVRVLEPNNTKVGTFEETSIQTLKKTELQLQKSSGILSKNILEEPPNEQVDNRNTGNKSDELQIGDRMTYSVEDMLRVELTEQESNTPKKDRMKFRNKVVFERDRDPDWSDTTEAGIHAGLAAMPEEFNFYEDVYSVHCSDVMCFIGVKKFNFKKFRELQISFTENVMKSQDVSRFKINRNMEKKPGIYIYRYYELNKPTSR